MKTILTVVLFSISLFSLGQNIDSMAIAHFNSISEEGTVSKNIIDSNGFKQGLWTHYSMLKLTACASGTGPNIIFWELSHGEYLNDKKIGEWLYPNEGRNQNVTIVKTEFYDGFGELLKTIETISQPGRIVNIINDSLEILADVRNSKFNFQINCKIDLCECLLDNEKLYEFKLENLQFEMDKLNAGIYNRQIIHNVKINPNE
jgi:hypothetical protein